MLIKKPVALAICGVILVAFSHVQAAQRPGTLTAPPATAAETRAVLDRYCVTCHNQRLQSGALTLDTVDLSNVAGNAERLEKVVRKLRAGAMPPQGAPRGRFAGSLVCAETIDQAGAAGFFQAFLATPERRVGRIP